MAIALPIALLTMLVASPFGSTADPVPDAALADMRGGFALANGMEIDLSVDTMVMVDGQTALISRFSTADGNVMLKLDGTLHGQMRSDGSSVTILSEGNDLSVTQQFGSRLSTIVANMADNRMIDVRTAITLTMDNVDPLSLGGASSILGAVMNDAALIRR